MEKWYLYCKKADFAGISRQFNISPMLARIIRNRDLITEEEIDRYLNGGVKDMYDPFMLKGMEEGVRLVSEKIKDKQRIRIIGDYDVDGICSSYILKTFIERAGGTADIRLPNRMAEGYGMNEGMAAEAARDGISLIITCDNGISSLEAVRMARQSGIDVVITDHHEAPDILPDANVIIDPKQPGCSYPYKEICGGGVAYKFIQGLDKYMGLHEEKLLDDLLQYAGMATITDIVPLIDENRIFAREGLKRMKRTSSPGLNALMEIRGINKEILSASNIGFILGPCLNSAGRLKDAKIAYDLIGETDPVKAYEIARELSDLNEKRKDLTLYQTENAFGQIEKRINEHDPDTIMVIYLPDAHESVAGIIAGRIKEVYNRPAIVVTSSEGGLKGSGRSTDYYNMIEGLNAHAELFVKYGGHAKACGFTLKQNGSAEDTVRYLSRCLNSGCSFTDKDLEKQIWIDIEIPFRYITEGFVSELSKLEPFGLKNEKPVFAGRNVSVISAEIIGRNSNAMKMLLEDSEGSRIEGLMFGNENDIRTQYESLDDSSSVSILFYPRINEYRGRKTPQIIVNSFKITK